MTESWDAHRLYIEELAKSKPRALLHWWRGHPIPDGQATKIHRRGVFLLACLMLGSLSLILVHPLLIIFTCSMMVVGIYMPSERKPTFTAFGYVSTLIRGAVRSTPRNGRRELVAELKVLDGKALALAHAPTTAVFAQYDDLLGAYLALAEKVEVGGKPGLTPLDLTDAPLVTHGVNDRGAGYLRLERGGRSMGLVRNITLAWHSATSCCGLEPEFSLAGMSCPCGNPHFGPTGLFYNAKNLDELIKAPLLMARDFLGLDVLEAAFLEADVKHFLASPSAPATRSTAKRTHLTVKNRPRVVR